MEWKNDGANAQMSKFTMTKEESDRMDLIMEMNKELYEKLDLPKEFPLGFTIRHQETENDVFNRYTYNDPEKNLRITVESFGNDTLEQVHEGTVESGHVRLLMREFINA